ncbi:bifunctional adenosylcobinamide kinase/adenosylcobinamide-phosphate guanylyltransferase [Clostridium sp. D2Q-14]|uniref:bifunctional adenosylcobinamide kinase/adenosylcobinamide-phosphate guanylyltransferase n=1 Tax=Anaeromonas gelatinilytica TaxID=2683194 RepID=UPI00193C104F|nr:bifunctional adenosylcobinamide kinase/adenosylcobinamide-phosphate guanylyltransferase [Anaeromonas gelatinilytica]MBS4535497.1 bifunctional adenosylcobinamide kinase/adenosylcobinamide-phosphate guanylyltransferase [Anaeromonas gelatinilytica]
MKSLVLVTGGARSGKSTFAESLVKETGSNIGYIATSIAFDEGMKDRIIKHRNSRPAEWITIERYKDFKEIQQNEEFTKLDTVILDCMTLMVSNLLLEQDIDYDTCDMQTIDEIEKSIFKEVKELLETLEGKNVVIVTNEVGMGIVPSYKLGSVFRDVAGRVNQYLASQAKKVYMTVSGIPISIK